MCMQSSSFPRVILNFGLDFRGPTAPTKSSLMLIAVETRQDKGEKKTKNKGVIELQLLPVVLKPGSERAATDVCSKH